MKKILLAAALTAVLPTTATAQASANSGKPANCAIYADMLSKTIKQDDRVTGTVEAEAVDTLDKFAAYLNSIVEAGMEKTYREAAAWGMDKATVDKSMVEGEANIRKQFVGYGMEPGRVYTDHLLAMNNCGKQARLRGELGDADVAKLETRMGNVFNAIR